MAEALVSQILEQLISVTTQQITENVRLVVGVDKQVENLTSNLEAIQAVLEDAEKRQVKEASVKRWLDKLKDMSYEMDDVLDEWSTAILKSQIQKDNQDGDNSLRLVPKKVRSFIPFPGFSFNRGIAKKIKVINGKLDRIAREKDMYFFNSIRAPPPQQREQVRQQTCSFLDASAICGRDQDKETLVTKLLSESHDKLHILSIVGMGGIGKTTLAQLAYNHAKVKAHFEIRMWVCVSDPFDEIRIVKAIVEQAGQSGASLDEQVVQSSRSSVELEILLQSMCKSIQGRKLLIVLDDVWVEDYSKWEPLKNCLQHGAQGSSILVTTRKERVAQMMGSSYMFQLRNLSEGDSWSLFSQLAFLGRASEECDKLEEIGRKIVSKCKGLPLAAKCLGSLMRFKRTKSEWQNVLDSEIWELEEVEKGLFPPLLFSLYDLPSTIRRCFSFCAVFPKDYEIKKDVLIKLWMAQGYLNSSPSKEMEITGQEYFESLAAHSFFQDFIKDDVGSIIQCKMHDIVHDFAQFLTRNEKVRHATDIQMPVFNDNAMNTRTLLYLAGNIALPDLFNHLTRLRALDLNAAAIEEVPIKVRNLMHLRYLNLSNNAGLFELPEEVCDLCNLESLNLNWCQSLNRLPQGIGKLINLRHLELEETSSLEKLPEGIGKLCSLRTLSKFIVSGDRVKCNIVMLKNMIHLQGVFYIDGLRNLVSVAEAEKANLKDKKNLLGLRLEFSGQKIAGGMDNDDDDVFEALQPNPNLESLHILSYQGTKLPSWMMILTNLRELILKDCKNCENVPPLGNLPALELLEIWYMYQVKTMGLRFLGMAAHDGTPKEDDILNTSSTTAFPKLKRLGFYGLIEWEDWYDWTGWKDDSLIMPTLGCLTIEYCPKLKALPHLLQTAPVQELIIRGCPMLRQRCQEESGEDWAKISHIPCIKVDVLNR